MPTETIPTWEDTEAIDETPRWEDTEPVEEKAKPIPPEIIGQGFAPSPITGRMGALGAPESGGTFQRSPSEIEAVEYMTSGQPFRDATEMLRFAAAPLAATKVGEFVSKPLKEVIKPATPQEVERELHTLMTGEEAPYGGIVPSRTANVIAGVQNTVADTVNFFTSPLGISTLGIGALPKTAQKAVAGAFAAQMASTLPETSLALWTELQKPSQERDEKEIARLVSNAIVTTGFTVAGAKHALAKGEPLPAPKGAQPKGEPYAVSEGIKPESYQQERERIDAQREAAETGGGNRPEPSRQIPTEEARPEGREVLLTPEPTPAQPVPPAEGVAKAKEPWEMTREDYVEEGYIQTGKVTDLALRRQVSEWQKRVDALPDSKGAAEGLARAQRKLNRANEHKQTTANALAEGKPVPPEVLADYPDLKPAPPPAEPQPSAVAAKTAGAEPLTARESIKRDSDEFRRLVRDYGEVQGWISRPDAVEGMEAVGVGGTQSTASIQAKMRGQAELAKAYKKALKDLGISIDRNTAKEHAAALPKLKALLAAHEKLEAVPLDKIPDGSEFTILGEKFEVKSTDPDTGIVTIKDGRTLKVDENSTVKIDPGSLKAPTVSEEFLPPEEPAKPSGELFPPSEMPFNLEPPKAVEMVEPKIETTGYGEQTLTQNELFGIQKVVESKDPGKSADAAQQMYGGPENAARVVERQLAILDQNKEFKKAFNKDQRQRLSDVIALLRQRAASKPKEGEAIGPGPGAMTAGEQPPPPIQQLADRLRATEPVGERETIALRDKLSDQWSEGKSITQRALGKLRSLSQSLKDTARGVRAITDLDRRIGTLDWELQQSVGRSQQAGRAMQAQMRNANQRRAIAIYIDTPGGEAAIRVAIPQLPASTPRQIRQAVESAANLTPEMKQFAEDLRSFFGQREGDAIEHGIFEHGLEDYFTHIWRKEANMPDSVRAAISNGRINDYFQFARKRKIGQFLEGILAGKVPELDPAKVIPHYNYTLDRAIASRMFVKDLSKINMPDGRPVVSPTGVAVPVERGGTPEGLIIDPSRIGDKGYRLIDHPALRKWKWAGTDENGNPVLYRSDLSVHPDAYERLARFMDRGRLTPTEWGRKALRLSTEVKGFKLGLLSAFHQVHVGSHALFHWTLPFNLRNKPWLNADRTINYDHPFVRFGIEKGHLKIAPDPGEISAMSEGLASPGLLHKIPIIGPWSKAYSEWTFGEYIPKLKVSVMENAYNRALWMRDKFGSYKGLTDDQIAVRIGDSVNNAFGELNHMFLGKFGRDPRFQRILRGIFLAPDFGEARLRFAEKGITRYGHEERIALATMFATFYLGARIANWLSHGDPEMDKKRAFEVKVGDHWWSMRSVVGDLHHAWKDFGQFMYVRLNPLYARTASDWLFGRDPQGRKINLFDKAISRPLQQLIPIQLGAVTRDDQKLWESFVTAMGVQTRKDRPEQDVGELARTWMKKTGEPKLEERLLALEQQVFPPSPYAPLKNALRFNDEAAARDALEKLKETRTIKQIDEAMKVSRPFAGSLKDEKRFYATLTPKQKELYKKAIEERKELYRRFRKLSSTPLPVSGWSRR